MRFSPHCRPGKSGTSPLNLPAGPAAVVPVAGHGARPAAFGRGVTGERRAARGQVQVQTFGRHPCRVPAARRFVRAVLAGHPAADDAELLACELVTNALRHAGDASKVTVTVATGQAGVHVEVTDDGTAGVPHWRKGAVGDEGGWGFHLVNEIATRWGFLRDTTGTCCWFDLDSRGQWQS